MAVFPPRAAIVCRLPDAADDANLAAILAPAANVVMHRGPDPLGPWTMLAPISPSDTTPSLPTAALSAWCEARRTAPETTLHIVGAVDAPDHLRDAIDQATFSGHQPVVHLIATGDVAALAAGHDLVDAITSTYDAGEVIIGTVLGARYADATSWADAYVAFHAIVRDPVLGAAAPVDTDAHETFGDARDQGCAGHDLFPVRLGEYSGVAGSFIGTFGDAGRSAWQWQSDDSMLLLNTSPHERARLWQLLTGATCPEKVVRTHLTDQNRIVRAFSAEATATAVPLAMPHRPHALSSPPLPYGNAFRTILGQHDIAVNTTSNASSLCRGLTVCDLAACSPEQAQEAVAAHLQHKDATFIITFTSPTPSETTPLAACVAHQLGLNLTVPNPQPADPPPTTL